MCGTEQSKELGSIESDPRAVRNNKSAFKEYTRYKEDVQIEGDTNFEANAQNQFTSKTSKRFSEQNTLTNANKKFYTTK